MLRSIGLLFGIAAALGIAGCRQDMQDQPKFVPLRGTTFFADGRSARLQLAGTVARGQEQMDSYFQTGLSGGKEGDGFPFPVTLTVLERGQERFNVYCSPCHSRVGNGEGRIVERGYYQAADFHSERLREAPAGHFFNVMTHGYGAMPDYHIELAPADRWAVAAYIRALQLSQSAPANDAAPGARVMSLSQIADEEGLPARFAADDWMHPRTPVAAPAASVSAPVPAAAAAPVNAVTASLAAARGKAQDGGAGQSAAKSGDEKPASGDQPAAAAPAVKAAGDAAAGKQLYTENCQVCHQANRQGIPPLIPSLEGIVAKVGVPKIRQTVTDGVPTAKPPMPSFASKFSATDIDNLIAFLQTKP